jgi:hypothetical protein
MRRVDRKILIAALVILIFVIAALAFKTAASPPTTLSTRDFIIYWSAGRAYLAGENPYDPARLAELQQRFGTPIREMTTFYYLPWTLALFAWLGYPDYPLSYLLWTACQAGLVTLCALYLWRLYGRDSRHLWIPALVLASYAPFAFLIAVGQSGGLILAGLVGFVILEKRGHGFLAGGCLALATFKPQLLLLVWLALILWVVRGRRWPVLAGMGSVLLGALVLVWLRHPEIVADFLSVAYKGYSLPPTLTALAASRLGNWVLLAPTLLGSIWLLVYWSRTHDRWEWSEQLPLLLCASLVVAPVSWAIDYILLLPAILYLVAKAPFRLGVAPYLVIDGAMWVLLLVYPVRHVAFFWVPLAVLVWFAVVRRKLAGSAQAAGGSVLEGAGGGEV